jgi:hypothetical protein
MVLSTARKPEGGFQFLSVAHLCAVWCAYRQANIQLADVRIWCAAQEMVARRCQLPSGQQPRYRHDELKLLVGKGGGVTAALARLQTAGLLTWNATALTFPQHAPHTDDVLAAMLAQIPNHQRRVPVPRRLLRFLAKGCSRVLLATTLGHLFRCLYYRQGQCRAEGFCKASWIAQVFGVSERAVKTARRRLETLGFLQRTETPQWVRNRYGQKMTINLQWDGAAMSTLVSFAAVSETAPPAMPESLEITPLDSNKKLLSEKKYQQPACGGPTGILSTLFAQARECLRSGTTLIEEPPPVLKPAILAPVQAQQSSTSVHTASPATPPHLQHVLLLDLQDMERLLALYAQAVQASLIGPSEAERLSFVALAHHVLRFKPVNPGGLFVQLLRQRRFDFITQQEEDRAQQRLKRYDYGDGHGFLRLAAA